MGTCGKSNEVKNNPQLLAVMNQASGICHNSKHTSANHTGGPRTNFPCALSACIRHHSRRGH